MPKTVDRDAVQQLVEEHRAAVVEVLPRPEFDWAHLPGATHLHLRELTSATAAEHLDRGRPVVVYCNDFP